MSCERYTELISAALDGELTPEERAELDAHLADCPCCRSLMEELSALDLELSRWGEEVPEGFAQRVMEAVRAEGPAAAGKPKKKRTWTRLASAAAVLALIVAGSSQILPAADEASLSGGASAPAGYNYTNESDGAMAESIAVEDSANDLAAKACDPAPAPESPAAPMESADPEPDHYFFTNQQSLRVCWGAAPAAPSARILGSAESLADFLTQFPEDDLSALTERYPAGWFDTGRLLAVVVESGSGSNRYELAPQGLLRDSVTVVEHSPEVGTCDMAAWLLLAETDTAFDDGAELEVRMSR